MRKIATMLTKNYIVSRLQGRIGNMMFQIANGYVQALKNNRQFVVPYAESSSGPLEKTLFRKLDFSIAVSPQSDSAKVIWAPFEFTELHPADDQPTVFTGWYQSEKFFGEYTEAIKNLFSPTKEFVQKATAEFPFLLTSTVAAINVRRGDYLEQPRRHPVITLEYIYEAVKHLPKYDYIIVLSDDIEWCEKNIKLDNVIFVKNYIECDGLWLLSLCDHFVISNSSYSWWGAYLSNTENKVVIAPDTWFGPDIHENISDIYCKNWIKIPTIWRDGFIHLK